VYRLISQWIKIRDSCGDFLVQKDVLNVLQLNFRSPLEKATDGVILKFPMVLYEKSNIHMFIYKNNTYMHTYTVSQMFPNSLRIDGISGDIIYVNKVALSSLKFRSQILQVELRFLWLFYHNEKS